MNLAYSLDDRNEVVSRPATETELKAARDAAMTKLMENQTNWAMRTCWNCNPSHRRFLEDLNDGYLLKCVVGCGRWFYQGVDITNYEEEGGMEVSERARGQ